MANLRKVARRKATKYGLKPKLFVCQIDAESGFNPSARSPAGAQGVAQIMPGTAAGWGVNPWKPRQALDAAAKNMANYIKSYGSYENALRAYNAGPAAIERSKGYAETNAYVAKILQSDNQFKLFPKSGNGAGSKTKGSDYEIATTRTLVPGEDNSDLRQSLLQNYVLTKDHDPDALKGLALGLLGARDTPDGTLTDTEIVAKPEGPGRTLYIGDSLGKGTIPALRQLGAKVKGNAKVGRQSVEGIEVLRRKLRNKGEFDTIVLDLGTNDPGAKALQRTIRAAKRLAPDANIIVPELHGGPKADRKNSMLEGMRGIQVADWNAPLSDEAARWYIPRADHLRLSSRACRSRPGRGYEGRLDGRCRAVSKGHPERDGLRLHPGRRASNGA